MSFGDRLIHELVIDRYTAGSDDEYGQPTQTFTPHATVRGLPQPKSLREVALTSDAGATIGDWTIFLQPSDLRESDRIRHVQTTCPVPTFRDLPTGTFQPTGIRNAAGIGHHLEVDARLTAASPVEGS